MCEDNVHMNRSLLVLFVLLLFGDAWAQSLGDAGRRERNRQRSVESKVNVTNSDQQAPKPTSPTGPKAVAPVEQPIENVRYYALSGTSPAELRQNINRIGPAADDGNRYGGRTNWNIEWRYNLEREESGCKVTNLETTLTVETILPKWTNESAAGPPVVALWRRFFGALLLHERGHKENGIACLAAIRALRPLPQRTCEATRSTMDAAARSVMDQFKSKDAQYDQVTRHGATQGATF